MNLSDWTNGPWNTWNISKNRQGVLWSPEGLLVARSNTLCGAPCKNCLCFLNNILLFCSWKNPASFETVNGHQIRVVIFQQLQVVFEDLVPNMLLQKIQSTLHEGCLLYLLLHSIRHPPKFSSLNEDSHSWKPHGNHQRKIRIFRIRSSVKSLSLSQRNGVTFVQSNDSKLLGGISRSETPEKGWKCGCGRWVQI